MKKYYVSSLIMLFILNWSIVNSQDPSDPKISYLKFNLNGFYQYESGQEIDPLLNPQTIALYTKEKYYMAAPSFSIGIKSNNFFQHEIEVLPLDFDRNDECHYWYNESQQITSIRPGTGVTTTIKSALRYQVNYNFTSNRKLMPYAGVSSQLFYNFFKLKPGVSYLVEESEQHIGLLFSITPGLWINLGERLAIDVNIPLGIYDIAWVREKNENPMISEEDRKVNLMEDDLIPDFVHVRLGMVFKLK